MSDTITHPSNVAYDETWRKTITLYTDTGQSTIVDVLRYCVLDGGVLCVDDKEGSGYFSPHSYISFEVTVQKI